MPQLRVTRDRGARALLDMYDVRRGGVRMSLVYELGGTPMCSECGRLFYARENAEVSAHVRACGGYD